MLHLLIFGKTSVQGTVFFPHVIEESDKLLIILKIIPFNRREPC